MALRIDEDSPLARKILSGQLRTVGGGHTVKPPICLQRIPTSYDVPGNSFPIDRLVVDPRSGFDPSIVLASLRSINAAWTPPETYRTQLETRYAARLDALRRAGEIEAWGYELLELRLARDRWIKVDWQVIRDGALELHETKGYLWKQDDIRLRQYLEIYPWPLRLARCVKGEWIIT